LVCCACAAGSYLYGRHFNPTLRHLGRQLAALEGTEAGYPTASGLSAVACTILNICSSGDHIVASHTLYGGSSSADALCIPVGFWAHCGCLPVCLPACLPVTCAKT